MIGSQYVGVGAGIQDLIILRRRHEHGREQQQRRRAYHAYVRQTLEDGRGIHAAGFNFPPQVRHELGT
jgi:hypothetical protein